MKPAEPPAPMLRKRPFHFSIGGSQNSDLISAPGAGVIVTSMRHSGSVAFMAVEPARLSGVAKA